MTEIILVVFTAITLVVLIIGFWLNRIELSIINKNQRFILDKIEEVNKKLKTEKYESKKLDW